MSDNYIVKLNFNDTINNYDFSYVFEVSDPQEGMKATVIKGTRGDGSIVIRGGKKSHEIMIKGKFIAEDNGYKDLVDNMAEMRSKITNNVATLTMKHLEGVSYVVDWTYTVYRIEEIKFPISNDLRTSSQEYEVIFYVTNY